MNNLITKYLDEIKDFMIKNCHTPGKKKYAKNEYIEYDDVILVRAEISGFRYINITDRIDYGYFLIDSCDVDIIEKHEFMIYFSFSDRRINPQIYIRKHGNHKRFVSIFTEKYPIKNKKLKYYIYENRNPLDLRKRNLIASVNKGVSIRNKTGLSGIGFYENFWQTSIFINGKNKTKRFSLSKYGKEAREMAIEWRKKMENKKFG